MLSVLFSALRALFSPSAAHIGASATSIGADVRVLVNRLPETPKGPYRAPARAPTSSRPLTSLDVYIKAAKSASQ